MRIPREKEEFKSVRHFVVGLLSKVYLWNLGFLKWNYLGLQEQHKRRASWTQSHKEGFAAQLCQCIPRAASTLHPILTPTQMSGPFGHTWLKGVACVRSLSLAFWAISMIAGVQGWLQGRYSQQMHARAPKPPAPDCQLHCRLCPSPWVQLMLSYNH